MTKNLCKYIINKGPKKGTQCPVKGNDDKYDGYCKRHFDRHIKDVNTKNVINDVADLVVNEEIQKDKKDFPIRQTIDFDKIINKYKHDEKTYDYLEKENKQLKQDTYDQYVEYCKVNNEMPEPRNKFNEKEFLKDVAEDLEEIHKPKYTEEFIRDSLFNLNLVAFSIVEKGSIMLKDMYPNKDIADLRGLTKDVYDEERLYKDVLYDIYVEHSEIIDNYISPLTTYALLSIKSIGTRAITNKKIN